MTLDGGDDRFLKLHARRTHRAIAGGVDAVGTVSADGEEVAWDTVRLKLQEIVDTSIPFSLERTELIGDTT